MNIVVSTKNTERSVVASEDVESTWLVVASIVAGTFDLIVGNLAAHLADSILGVDGQLVACIMRPYLFGVIGPVVAEGRRVRGHVIRRCDDLKLVGYN